ncbi:MAG TPA: TIGR03013 family PEP-CTERM/XrtA system glycosyltransferase [Gammaproteobacteria bacterium]|nr:TIGR03013 family PEP-CTERM/XrtA system glycosyltransferase [Gammaproteobacteria bacterium]
MIRFFHFIPGTYFLLGLLEAVSVQFSVFVAPVFRYGLQGANRFDHAWVYLPTATVFAFVMYLSMTAMGMYWRGLREDYWGIVFRLAASSLVAVTIMSIIFYSIPSLALERRVFGYAVIISFTLILLFRSLHYFFSDHEALRQRVLVLGTGKKAGEIDRLRRKSDKAGFTLVGFVHVSGQRDLLPMEKILYSDKPLVELVREHEVDEIIVAIDDRRKSFPVDEMLECKMMGVYVVDLSDFLERQTRRIKLETLHPSSMIFSEGYSQAVLKKYSKRLFDIGVSILMLILVWPLMLLTALAILLETGMPVLYRQQRVGKGGRLFNVLKFRSMYYKKTDSQEPNWTQVDDERVTRVGRLIRRIHLDELPQLINVLRGEMSFVGPRPETPQFVEKLSSQIPFYNLRHKVNPGITGWAQISYPYGSSLKDAVAKLEYDLYYMKQYSMLFDFMIMMQTAQAIILGKGMR